MFHRLYWKLQRVLLINVLPPTSNRSNLGVCHLWYKQRCYSGTLKKGMFRHQVVFADHDLPESSEMLEFFWSLLSKLLLGFYTAIGPFGSHSMDLSKFFFKRNSINSTFLCFSFLSKSLALVRWLSVALLKKNCPLLTTYDLHESHTSWWSDQSAAPCLVSSWTSKDFHRRAWQIPPPWLPSHPPL